MHAIVLGQNTVKYARAFIVLIIFSLAILVYMLIHALPLIMNLQASTDPSCFGPRV